VYETHPMFRSRNPWIPAWATILALLLSTPGNAAVLTTAGDVNGPVAPVPSVQLDIAESDATALLFREQRNLLLPSSVDVGLSLPGYVEDPSDLTPDTILAGTRVDSWFLHTDPVTTNRYIGSVRFDRAIIGIMVDGADVLASNAVLGAPGTTYTVSAGALDLGSDYLSLSPDRRKIEFSWRTNAGMDQIRILTEPTPEWSYVANFVHRWTDPSNSSPVIEYRSSGGRFQFVTPNFNPGGGPGVVMDEPFMLKSERIILTGSGAVAPVGASFNYLVMDQNDCIAHGSSASNISGHTTAIDNPATNGQPNLRLLLQSYDADHTGFVSEFPSVYYSAGRWRIFLQDTSAVMPEFVGFYIYVLPDDGTNFVHSATSSSPSTLLDDSRLNGKPDAIIHVTQVWNPGGVGGVYNNHPIAVAYDDALEQWAIVNQDGGNFNLGASFNVFIPPAPSFSWQHTATVANTAAFGHITDTSNPDADGSAAPILLETQNLAPMGGPAAAHPTPTGIYYSGVPGWSLYSEDSFTPYPIGAASNLYQPPIDFRTYVHLATLANVITHRTFLTHPLIDDDPSAVVFATRNWSSDVLFSGTNSNHHFGLYYTGSEWAVFNEDFGTHDLNVAYNIHVPGPDAQAFTHTAISASIAGNRTTIDDPSTNGQPDLRLIITHNWSPPGGASEYNDHPTGVDYDAGSERWQIVNLDGAAMPEDVAFNVLPVPEPDLLLLLGAGLALLFALRPPAALRHPVPTQGPRGI
jgi:hypothetical protein